MTRLIGSLSRPPSEIKNAGWTGVIDLQVLCSPYRGFFSGAGLGNLKVRRMAVALGAAK
jgi:hypothetical protein